MILSKHVDLTWFYNDLTITHDTHVDSTDENGDLSIKHVDLIIKNVDISPTQWWYIKDYKRENHRDLGITKSRGFSPPKGDPLACSKTTGCFKYGWFCVQDQMRWHEMILTWHDFDMTWFLTWILNRHWWLVINEKIRFTSYTEARSKLLMATDHPITSTPD